MVWHRNSQKRIYVPGGIYFITTNTYDRRPYFKDDILCELFMETLEFTNLIKEFNLHGLAINLEHIHLLIEPTGKYNYSEIIGTLKRNFARDCNLLLSGKGFRRDGNPYFITHLEKLSTLQARYFVNHNHNHNHNHAVPFQWQTSFRDHIIRDQQDYINHLNYIMKQPFKHHLPGRKWYWVAGDDS